MPIVKYIEAEVFLNEYLPEELYSKPQEISSGGYRILLYWKPSIQANNDGTGRFFSEFGRTYLGQYNTNQPHNLYIENILKKLYNSLRILKKQPSFSIEEVMNRIPWKEKEKSSISDIYK